MQRFINLFCFLTIEVTEATEFLLSAASALSMPDIRINVTKSIIIDFKENAIAILWDYGFV